MQYDELLEKYLILEEENRSLKEEIQRLKLKSVAKSATEYMHASADVAAPNNMLSSDYKLTQSSLT